MTKKINDRIFTIMWIAGGAAILLLGIAMGFLAPWIELTFTDYAPDVAFLFAIVGIFLPIRRVLRLKGVTYRERLIINVHRLLLCAVLGLTFIATIPEGDIFSVNAMVTIIQMLTLVPDVAILILLKQSANRR